MAQIKKIKLKKLKYLKTSHTHDKILLQAQPNLNGKILGKVKISENNRKYTKAVIFHAPTRHATTLIMPVTLPLSSSARAEFASCQLSELLEDFSPKFMKVPKLNAAAMLDNVSHKSTPVQRLSMRMLGSLGKNMTNQRIEIESSREITKHFARKGLFSEAMIALLS